MLHLYQIYDACINYISCFIKLLKILLDLSVLSLEKSDLQISSQHLLTQISSWRNTFMILGSDQRKTSFLHLDEITSSIVTGTVSPSLANLRMWCRSRWYSSFEKYFFLSWCTLVELDSAPMITNIHSCGITSFIYTEIIVTIIAS